jgi:superfamily II DNA helicase RecQ
VIDVDNNPTTVNIHGKALQCRVLRINMTHEDNRKDIQLLNKFLTDYKIISIKEQFVTGKIEYWLVFVNYKYQPEKQDIIHLKKDNKTNNEDSSAVDEELIAKLKKWRNEMCKQLTLPAYVILQNKTAEELAKTRPTTYDNLDKIKGNGEKVKEKYGSEIIDLITNHKKESAR